jgi:hypothetical protein
VWLQYQSSVVDVTLGSEKAEPISRTHPSPTTFGLPDRPCFLFCCLFFFSPTQPNASETNSWLV